MNDIQLRWTTRTTTRILAYGYRETFSVNVLQYRKYYDRTIRACVSLPEHSRFEDWGWSEWMDVPNE